MQIANRVFVVTGGGNGIGREVVLELLDRGATVAALDLREEGLAETARLAGGRAAKLGTYAADVSDRDRVNAVAGEITAAHGPVDGLLNVAGIIQPFIAFAELDYPAIEKVMNVNFWGVVNTCKEFLPGLLTRPEAALVNVSSMGALAPVPGQTVYGASKSAVKLLTEGLYAEAMGTNLAVTIVFPGGVSTDITGNSGVEMSARASARAAEDAAAGAPDTEPTARGVAGVLDSAKRTVGGLIAKVSGKKDRAASYTMTTPQDAAAQIVDGIEKGSYRVVIGSDARGLDKLSRLNPQKATELIAKKMAGLRG